MIKMRMRMMMMTTTACEAITPGWQVRIWGECCCGSDARQNHGDVYEISHARRLWCSVSSR